MVVTVSFPEEGSHSVGSGQRAPTAEAEAPQDHIHQTAGNSVQVWDGRKDTTGRN